MELDKDRLAKLLNLTDSEHDGEALAAIRKANDLLRLSKTSWSAALGLAPSQGTTTPAEPPADRSPHQPGPARAAAAPSPPPPGYQRTQAYRDAFRHEPLLPRLLGFPFWIVVEILALAAPNTFLNVRGPWLMAVFTLSMTLGIAVWIGLAYSLLVGFG